MVRLASPMPAIVALAQPRKLRLVTIVAAINIPMKIDIKECLKLSMHSARRSDYFLSSLLACPILTYLPVRRKRYTRNRELVAKH